MCDPKLGLLSLDRLCFALLALKVSVNENFSTLLDFVFSGFLA